MKQIFQAYPSRLLLCLLFTLIGGGNFAWGANADVTYDFTGSDWTAKDGTLSNGTVSFTGASSTNGSFKMNSGYFMLGKSGAYLNFPTYSSPVEKIVVTGNSGASVSVIQNIYVGNDAVSTATTGATGGNTYNINSNYQTAGTQYTLKVTSSHNTQITKIEIFYAKEASPLASIAVDASSATTVFHVGDTFTHEGAVVTATYEDKSTKEVTADATFSKPDMTSAGTKTVTVTYTENEVVETTSYDINVLAPATLESISLSGSYPTEFTQGDAFSSEGIVVTANYDDKTTKDVTEDAEFSGYNMSTTGSQTVTVTYEGKTATYNITVNENVMPSVLSVDFESALSTYKEWTFTNAVQDKTTITAHGGTYYGTTGGKQTAAFQTKDKIANPGTFTCYVSKQTTNSTSSTWYIQVSSDASTWTEVKTQSATDMVKGVWKEFTADLSDYSNVYVRLYYSGSTAVRNVDDITLEMATPQVLSSIALSGEYPTTFHQGDAFSHEGMIVTATYKSGKTADVTESATFSGYNMNATGEQTVTVSYTQNEVTETATYDIIVNAPATLESIVLSGDYPTEFEQGDEFSSEGIVVTAHWSDETTSNVTEVATFEGYDMSTLGKQTVTVSYGGKTATSSQLT